MQMKKNFRVSSFDCHDSIFFFPRIEERKREREKNDDFTKLSTKRR